MSFGSVIFIYVMIWWVMIFTVLPMGVRRHGEAGTGHDPGAPEKADLKKKIILNSIISAVIVAVIYSGEWK